jgi:hypothetical protein
MEVLMAKARMLHKKISISTQVNRLSLPARLLFTWMISHADDEGKLKGDPEYIKATVVPMTKWSFKLVKDYLLEIKNQGLIHYWEENKEWFIEFVKWTDHQQIRKDRFEDSCLPSFNKENGNHLSTKRQPDNYQETAQSNITESNEIEENISEYEYSEENIADKNSSSKESVQKVNPNYFSPINELEFVALDAWKQIEPDNPDSFSFYLWAGKQGLPNSKFYEFASEIRQDNSIKNPGAVFNKKVKEYLEGE